MKYSLDHRIFTLQRHTLSYHDFIDEWQGYFAEVPPSERFRRRLWLKFSVSGSVADLPRSGRPRTARTIDNIYNLPAYFYHVFNDAAEVINLDENRPSIYKAAEALGISASSARRILKYDVKWQSRCPKRCQTLSENDIRVRALYCGMMIRRLNDDPSFLDFIIWSDEALFKLNGQMRTNAIRYWYDGSNKKVYPRKNTRTSLMVSVGIWRGGIIGPFFFEDLPRIRPPGETERIDHMKYLQMLQVNYIPEIEAQIPLTDPTIREKVWFQLDGASIHTAINVRDFLDAVFPELWMGNAGHISWPPNSPDLTPLDFSFWGVLKTRVYRRCPSTKAELKNIIVDECAKLTYNYLENICVSGVMRRFRMVCARNGRHIEHLL